MSRTEGLLSLADSIDSRRAAELGRDLGQSEARATGVLLGTAFPPLRPAHGWQVEALAQIVEDGWRARRGREDAVAGFRAALAGTAPEATPRELRRETWRQRARIALREILPRSLGGAPFDVTARELSYVAEAAFDAALGEGVRRAEARSGAPLRADSKRSVLTVLGMGKLGGLELNAGSDIDVVLIYDTDDGAAGPATLHEFWTDAARETVALLDTPTEDGFVWRVDFRLRPEGSQGPIVYSWGAAERYYETWGRLWERAALLRGRPVAGDLELGEALFAEVLLPFVFQRSVDPSIATLLAELVQKSRAELRADAELDLKLGRGGIREAEFFVQSLQLIWGGRESSLRVTGTLAALERLEAKGLVSDRELRDVAQAYVLLRRAEHAVQWRTGVQTHCLPREDDELSIIGRILGYRGSPDFSEALAIARAAVAERFASLLPEAPRPPPRYTLLLAELEERSETLDARVEELFGDVDLADHLLALSRRPDGLLGTRTRERAPELADRLLEAIRSSPDPEQAARYLRAFFGRFPSAEQYAAMLEGDPRALPRLISVLGASAFVADAFVLRPDLADVALFGGTRPSVAEAARIVEQELEPFRGPVAAGAEPADVREEFIGALRRAQRRVTVEVAVADLAGEITTREATRVLSALADAIVENAVAWVTAGDPTGLAVIAVGKLGGGDIGYGSDLDVLFIYDPARAPEGAHPPEHFSKIAQRIIRLIGEPHTVGPGYELDTRLRPSGTKGLLVTSLSSFARYNRVPLEGVAHDPDQPMVLSSGAAWERQALLRARPCAGDMKLAARFMNVACAAAYEREAAPAQELHHLRLRMERELGRERPGRSDLKAGRGGLLDVEFAVQWLQMRHGKDHRVRTTDTVGALHALREAGYIDLPSFHAFHDGYLFLRRLEQRIRIVHGTSLTVLDDSAAGLGKLARRMAIRRSAEKSEGEALLEDYAVVTEQVRHAYLRVLGLPDDPR